MGNKNFISELSAGAQGCFYEITTKTFPGVFWLINSSNKFIGNMENANCGVEISLVLNMPDLTYPNSKI